MNVWSVWMKPPRRKLPALMVTISGSSSYEVVCVFRSKEMARLFAKAHDYPIEEGKK